MKILYGAGNYAGANLQLARFVAATKHKHEIRSAAYYHNSDCLANVDWLLDSLKTANPKQKKLADNLFAVKLPINVDANNIALMLEDIANWEPDIAVIDYDPITFNIAKSLNIKCISCSPLNLINGIDWEARSFGIYSSLLSKAKKVLSLLSAADYKFIYSPFGDVVCRPFLNSGYDWIQPYHILPNKISGISNNSLNMSYILNNISNNEVIHTGDTNVLSDSIYNNKVSLLFPNYKDPESIVNTILCEEYGVGFNMGKIGISLNYIKETLEKFKHQNCAIELSVQSYKFLHEKIEEVCKP